MFEGAIVKFDYFSAHRARWLPSPRYVYTNYRYPFAIHNLQPSQSASIRR